jgi:hypothetical protein
MIKTEQQPEGRPMPTKRQKLDLRHAHHEAGHAVVARKLGLGVVCVTLHPVVGEYEAAAEICKATFLSRNADRAIQVAAIEADAKVCLAGPSAQQRYQLATEESIEESIANEWADDIQNAQVYVARAVRINRGLSDGTLPDDAVPEAEQQLRQLACEADALVVENWSAIAKLAKALVRCGRLSGSQIDDLLGFEASPVSPWSSSG